MQRPTARDVAALAQVSCTAVSFVFTGRAAGNLSPETQRRIRAAADHLGYRPDQIARSLRTRRSGVVGVLSAEIATSPSAGRMVLGAMEAARERGHQVLLLETRLDPAAEAEAAAELRARGVEGIVCAAMSLRRADVPRCIDPERAVLANCLPRVPGSYACVVPDERAGGRAAVEVLTGSGHTDVAFLGGPRGEAAAGARVRGFRDGLRAAGLGVREEWVLRVGGQIDEGYAAALRVLDRRAGPTGVVCANDRVAAGVLLAAARLGIDVPGELSVVGYEDQNQLAGHLVPALTTVALPHHAIGATAVRILLEPSGRTGAGPGDRAAARAPAPARTTRLKCPVVVRESVRPPAARG